MRTLHKRLTSTVFESKGSFQAGFRNPTLLETSVRMRYFGCFSVSYWLTPLSIASMASMYSLYTLSQSVCTFSSSGDA